MTTLLAARGLRHAYGRHEVLRGVDLRVGAGEIVGLLGPNGAGKSTCFHLLAGVLSSQAGVVELRDRDVTHLPLEARARLGLGFLPQETSVFRGLSALQNVRIALELAGVPRPERDAAARRLLADVSASEVSDVRADRLSGGERRKVEIARLLALRPAVLLLDEPLTGLDPIASDALCEVLRRLAESGLGVLFTDHHVGPALATCDRALLLLEGRIAVQGSAEEVSSDPLARDAYLGNG